MSTKVVQLTNDVWSAFYLDGKKICECHDDELDAILGSLGFSLETREDYSLEKFPEELS